MPLIHGGEKFQASFRNNVAPSRIVVFSEALTIDSHGTCVIVKDVGARQTKYLMIGEPACQACGKCARVPLLADTILVDGRETEVELKCYDLRVSEAAKAYCMARGVRLTQLSKRSTIVLRNAAQGAASPKAALPVYRCQTARPQDAATDDLRLRYGFRGRFDRISSGFVWDIGCSAQRHNV
ncbi:hypothetical protein [Methylogaea oryzae]|nr:hypothetical protein [Methylogaea oryzae]